MSPSSVSVRSCPLSPTIMSTMSCFLSSSRYQCLTRYRAGNLQEPCQWSPERCLHEYQLCRASRESGKFYSDLVMRSQIFRYTSILALYLRADIHAGIITKSIYMRKCNSVCLLSWTLLRHNSLRGKGTNGLFMRFGTLQASKHSPSCSKAKLIQAEGTVQSSFERLECAGLKSVRTSGGYLIKAFLGAVGPYAEHADRLMASLKGTRLTADHTFR